MAPIKARLHGRQPNNLADSKIAIDNRHELCSYITMHSGEQMRSTVWIQPKTSDTSELLHLILDQIRGNDPDLGARARFLVEPGTALARIQAVRMMLSRTRKSMTEPMRHFLLKSEIIPWTMKDGTRYECIIVWEHRTKRHRMKEMLEERTQINGR